LKKTFVNDPASQNVLTTCRPSVKVIRCVYLLTQAASSWSNLALYQRLLVTWT